MKKVDFPAVHIFRRISLNFVNHMSLIILVLPFMTTTGKTYPNECILRVEACKFKKSLRILYNGECGGARGSNPCSSLDCHPYQECQIDRYGIATCLCPEECPPVLKPVCGSDGVTYDSECHLRQKSCLNHDLVSLSFYGTCHERHLCPTCSLESVCHITSPTSVKSSLLNPEPGVCLCPVCGEEYSPVCGSNGVSFPNQCRLKEYSCQNSVAVTVVHEKACQGCENKHCDFYGLCKSLDSSASTCICPDKCPTSTSSATSVCGSDGVTYESECEMKRASCESKTLITVASRGNCDLCVNVHCKYGAKCLKGRCVCPTDCPESVEPVCSNTGVTFSNECLMRRAACQRSLEMSVSFYGECSSKKLEVSDQLISGGYITTCDSNTCRFGGVCAYDSNGIPHCICSFQCPSSSFQMMDEETVCGSDGRLYENECKLQEEACRRQQEIKVESYRSCQDSKVTPCQGDPPVIDFKTGNEIDCEGTSCPSGSYCHKSLHFSKCCKERVAAQSCQDSMYGCCDDGSTPAGGPSNAGCPSLCNCNKLGSFSLTCDPKSNQCHCKSGVGGLQCDRCQAGFWGLHKISEGNSGCLPCSCNLDGSLRDDCEQMTGRCVCKPGVQGIKCNVCPVGTVLDEQGCIDASLSKTFNHGCNQVKCKFGAICRETNSGSQCYCPQECSLNSTTRHVCASNGLTYSSLCHLQRESCRLQKKIVKIRDQECQSLKGVTPSGPVKRSTINAASRMTSVESYSMTSFMTSVSQGLTTTATTPPTQSTNAYKTEILTPSFSGTSFLELPRLEAYTRLTIHVDFTSFSDNGVILYNGQTASGEGDFVSLTLRSGFVELRFNLGSGILVLRSPQKVLLGEMTTVIAKRYLKEGTLTVEGQEDVAGKAVGDLKSLDLAEHLFLGSLNSWTPKIVENLGGVNQGFLGCLHRLKIAEKEVNLSREALKSVEVIECSDNVCSKKPCLNAGTCVPEIPMLSHSTQGYQHSKYSCTCDQGFTGKKCGVKIRSCGPDSPCVRGTSCTLLQTSPSTDGKTEVWPGLSCICPSGVLCSDTAVKTFSFSDFSEPSSYLKMSCKYSFATSFVIELVFMPRKSSQGVLIYSRKGDLLSLSMTQSGFLEFKFDLGSGGDNNLTLVTKNAVTVGEWHSIRISRIKKEGAIQLDDQEVVSGFTIGPLEQLNLDSHFFVGGHPDSLESFDGLIQRLVVNGEVWDDLVDRAVEVAGVTKKQSLRDSQPDL